MHIIYTYWHLPKVKCLGQPSKSQIWSQATMHYISRPEEKQYVFCNSSYEQHLTLQTCEPGPSEVTEQTFMWPFLQWQVQWFKGLPIVPSWKTQKVLSIHKSQEQPWFQAVCKMPAQDSDFWEVTSLNMSGMWLM